MAVPYTFSSATSAIPLSQLDSNFATTITLGNTAIQLGNTVTTLNNMTLANVTVSSGNVTITNVSVTTANITTANITTDNITNANISANVTLTGVSGRIVGDFSNATVASRTSFITATANSSTGIYALPSGTSTAASWQATNAADPTNASKILIATNGSTDVQLVSGINGTGTYLPLTFYTSGAEKMRLDTSGNLGLGVTPSASSLSGFIEGAYGTFGQTSSLGASISGNAYYNSGWKYKVSSTATLQLLDSGGFKWNVAGSGTAGNAITFTQAMTLDASGNLGINVTSPACKLDIFPVFSGSTGTTLGVIANADIYVRSGGYVNQYGQICFGYAGNNAAAAIGFLPTVQTGNTYGDLVFGTRSVNTDTAPTERMRIDSSGNLLVGKTAQGLTTAGFEVRQTNAIVGATASPTTNADTNYHLYSTGAGAYRFYVGYGGTVYATSTTISAISDIRFKENVRDLDAGLAEVMALKPRLYDWKEGKGADIKNARGFIAQEFEEVFPDLIDEWKDPAPEGEEPYKSVRQDLIPVLVKAIQEQQAIINTLTARIEALEAK